MRVLFWGAGNELKLFFQKVDQMPDVFGDDKITVVDRDGNKYGKRLCGRLICNPSEMTGLKFDQIIITSQKYHDQILADIIGVFGDNITVLDLNDYIKRLIVSYQYNKHHDFFNKDYALRKAVDIPINYIIYTAITGGYDKLREPAIVEDNIEYICFTDDDNLRSNVWKIRRIDMGLFSSPIDAIKHIKILPHVFLKEYDCDYSIWLDANMAINRSMTDLLKLYMTGAKLLLFPHMERICLYDEAMICVEKGIAKKDVVLQQIFRYYSEAMPINAGLYCGGFLGRYHTDPDVIATMEDWLQEVKRGCTRDQISLPYILYKHDLNFDLTNENYYKNTYISSSGHNSFV